MVKGEVLNFLSETLNKALSRDLLQYWSIKKAAEAAFYLLNKPYLTSHMQCKYAWLGSL